MSYSSTWDYLMKLTLEAQYTEQVQDGHWIWVYDNLNLHQTVRHEREGTHRHIKTTTTNKQVSIGEACLCVCIHRPTKRPLDHVACI